MSIISDRLSQGLQWLTETLSQLSIRSDYAPLDSVERLFQFVSTRSALVAQKKLYGYLKERMGLKYPTAFEDSTFARSIDIAKMQVFAASLSDLTVFALAQCGRSGRLAGSRAAGHGDRLLRRCHARQCRRGSRSRGRAAVDRGFSRAGGYCPLGKCRRRRGPFTESPKALFRWAPIADELKKYDREIVENSIRFAWNEVTQDFRKRLDAAAVVRDWRETGPAG